MGKLLNIFVEIKKYFLEGVCSFRQGTQNDSIRYIFFDIKIFFLISIIIILLILNYYLHYFYIFIFYYNFKKIFLKLSYYILKLLILIYNDN